VALNVGTLEAKLTADVKSWVSNMRKAADEAGAVAESAESTQGSLDRVAKRMQTFGGIAVGAATAAGTAMWSMGKDASNLAEEMSKAGQVFGSEAETIIDWSSRASAEFGQSQRAALEAAGQFGVFADAFGYTESEAADFSITLTELASDLASFNNTSPEEAVLALGAALRGESEPIRRYGVLLDDATLKQRALELGLISTTTGTLPPAIRAQAAYAEILDQTTLAQGDFARTADGVANQSRTLAAQFEDARAALGEGFLPVMSTVLDVTNRAAAGFLALNEATSGVAGQVAAWGVILVGVVGSLSLFAGTVIRARDNIRSMGKALAGVRWARMAAGLGAIGTAVGGIMLAKEALGALGLAAKGAQVDIERMSQMGTDELVRNFIAAKQAAEEIGLAGRDLDYFRMIAEGNIGTAERLRDRLAEVGMETSDYDAILADLTRSQRQVRDDTERAAEMIEGSGEAAADAAPDVDRYADATSEAGRAAAEAAGMIDRQREALRQARDAVNRSKDAQLDYRMSQLDAADAMAEYEAVVGDAEATDADRERALIRTERALIDMARAAAEAAGAEEGSARAAEIQASKLDAVASKMAPASPLRQNLDQYIARLGEVPEMEETELRAEVATAVAEIARVAQQLWIAERAARAAQQAIDSFTGFSGGSMAGGNGGSSSWGNSSGGSTPTRNYMRAQSTAPGPSVTNNITINEKADPGAIAAEIAWRSRVG